MLHMWALASRDVRGGRRRSRRTSRSQAAIEHDEPDVPPNASGMHHDSP